jgi:hypothetical protein
LSECSLTAQLLLPGGPDQPQLALRRRPRPAQLGRDLVVAEALHLPQRHRPRLLIGQASEQAFALLGHLQGERRRRLPADDPGERRALPAAGGRQVGLGAHGAAAELLAELVLHQVGGLARGDQHQQLPEVAAVEQTREAARLGAAAEAVAQ